MSEKTAIVFFDSECNFCRSMICYLMKIDKNNKLYFAPLKGATAEKSLTQVLPDYTSLNTLVFLKKTGEHTEIYLYSKAVFKIFDHLGGFYTLIGWLSFFPPFFDIFYKFIAKHRRSIKTQSELDEKDPRLLP